MLLMAVITLFVAQLPAPAQGRVRQVAVTGLVGRPVRLPCRVDEAQCGPIHNIQWYRGDGDTRVFIFSELASVQTDENMLQGRGHFHYTSGSPLTELEINPLRTDDQSLYKCELTYLEVRDECAVIQFVNLTTLAQPSSLTIRLEDGSEVPPGTEVGPYREGSRLSLTCESAGGKPPAAVSWWNGTLNIGGSAVKAGSLRGSSSSTLQLRLTRHDLGAEFECQASNAALTSPLRAAFRITMQVPPLKVSLEGPRRPLKAGMSIVLTCTAHRAQPAAAVTWWLDGELMSQEVATRYRVQEDGTTDTISEFAMVASPSDNGRHVQCRTFNQVLRERGEELVSETAQLRVRYAPIITMSPDVIRANQSSDVLMFCSFDANPSNVTDVVWYQDDRHLDTSASRYDGDLTSQPSLFIRNVSTQDAGRYSCQLANSEGVGRSQKPALLTVLLPPKTTLNVTPDLVDEADLRDVILRCDVTKGDVTSESQLTGVAWYKDDELQREMTLGNCSRTGPTTEECAAEPVLPLRKVDRSSRGSYSCAGRSQAGWGAPSPGRQLTVHYPPSQPVLMHEPSPAIKGSPLTLTCGLEDPGNPPADRHPVHSTLDRPVVSLVHRQYIWMRGNHVFADVTQPAWNISAASLLDNTTFSCVAANQAGNSAVGQTAVLVLGKPQFIRSLPHYMDSLANSSGMELMCQVECSPICGVQWLRNGQVIANGTDPMIQTRAVAGDRASGTLESVVSVLSWTGAAWFSQEGRDAGGAGNISCRSTANGLGPPVTSTTVFSVEKPPANISVSASLLEVVEGEAAASVVCSSGAFPEASYTWIRDDEAVQRGRELRLGDGGGVRRSHAGQYVCHARNRHGYVSTTVLVNVLYKPECQLRQSTSPEGTSLLTCQADGVPSQLTFAWWLDDRPVTSGMTSDDDVSQLTVLDGGGLEAHCRANNSVGAGAVCSLKLQSGGGAGWPALLAGPRLALVVGGAISGLLLLLLALLIALLLRRRRRADVKHGMSAHLEEQESSPQPEVVRTEQPAAAPVHKWPVRPGVQLHVSSMQSLSKLADLSPGHLLPADVTDQVVTLRRIEVDADTKPNGVARDGRPVDSASPALYGATDVRIGGSTGLHHGAPHSAVRLSDPALSRPPSELSQNDSSGYGSTFSRGAAPYGSVRSTCSLQWTRSPPLDAPNAHAQVGDPPTPSGVDACGAGAGPGRPRLTRADSLQLDTAGRCHPAASRGVRQAAAPLRPSPLVGSSSGPMSYHVRTGTVSGGGANRDVFGTGPLTASDCREGGTAPAPSGAPRNISAGNQILSSFGRLNSHGTKVKEEWSSGSRELNV